MDKGGVKMEILIFYEIRIKHCEHFLLTNNK